MAALTKVPGCGTVLELDPAGGSTYAAVGKVSSLTLPSESRAAVNAPELASCIDYPMPGTKTAGEFSITLFFEPGGADEVILRGLMDSKVYAAWKVSFPQFGYILTDPSVAWLGWVSDISYDETGGDTPVQWTITGQLVSAVTEVAGADA